MLTNNQQENQPSEAQDMLLYLVASGRHVWAEESADEYVRRLREGWE
jgi:hypothetical protein